MTSSSVTVHLILGGHGKGASYRPIVEASQKNVKQVYLIGEDARVIQDAFDPDDMRLIVCETLENAVREASGRAVPGETVLLSPACASYDQFQNFEHRGECFREFVHAL